MGEASLVKYIAALPKGHRFIDEYCDLIRLRDNQAATILARDAEIERLNVTNANIQSDLNDMVAKHSHAAAEIERLNKIEAAAKAIYFAGHWESTTPTVEVEFELWKALQAATGWSVSAEVK